MTKTKPFDITRKEVWRAYEVVKANKGAGGIDGVDLLSFEENLKDNLYKIWNRMSSGTYFPQPLKAISIPKKSGGTRTLKIPTVADRIAQTVVKQRIEPNIEPYFYVDSYGYRPNKSAHDAIEATRSRCWKFDWVLEFDIVGLFDNINQNLLMKVVRKHVKEKWQVLYIERWLKSVVDENGKDNCGVPQGGVISPILANLFMHYAFDRWISQEFENIAWCRYADDGLVHCKTERQAIYIKYRLAERLKECGLAMHEEKTSIVYCKDSNRKKEYDVCNFTFLGYEFRQRKAKGKDNQEFSSFLPAISTEAKSSIRKTIREWRLLWMTNKELNEIADIYNPVIRGWLNYYGKYGKRELSKVLVQINRHLCMWFRRKHKKYKHKKRESRLVLKRIATENATMFAHWKVGITEMVG